MKLHGKLFILRFIAIYDLLKLALQLVLMLLVIQSNQPKLIFLLR